MHACDYRTRTEEEQGLEERMRDDVKYRCCESTDAARQKHIAKLGNSRISKNFLDVVLGQADGGGKQRRGCADDRHYEHGGLGMDIDCGTTNDPIHAGSNHRLRMYQRGDWRRAGPGVREPNEEWY